MREEGSRPYENDEVSVEGIGCNGVGMDRNSGIFGEW
jgi:hypothetical protein